MSVKISQIDSSFTYRIMECDIDFSRFIVLDEKDMKQLAQLLKGLGF